MSFSSGAWAVLPAIPSLLNPAINPEVMVETAPREVNIEDYQPITDSKNVERFINDYFADIPVMANIAKCESQYRQFNSNGEILKGKKNSYDRGVMQINVLYHSDKADELGLAINTIEDNVSFARYLYEKYGAKPWIASSACWAKFSPTEIAKK